MVKWRSWRGGVNWHRGWNNLAHYGHKQVCLTFISSSYDYLCTMCVTYVPMYQFSISSIILPCLCRFPLANFYKSFKIRQFHWWIFQWTNRIDGFLPICSKNMPMESSIIFSLLFCFVQCINLYFHNQKNCFLTKCCLHFSDTGAIGTILTFAGLTL